MRIYSSVGGDAELRLARARSAELAAPRQRRRRREGARQSPIGSARTIESSARRVAATSCGSRGPRLPATADMAGSRSRSPMSRSCGSIIGADYKRVDQFAVWNGDHAYCYPSLATNSDGEVGISLAWGGGTTLYGSHAVGILGDWVVWYGEASDVTVLRKKIGDDGKVVTGRVGQSGHRADALRRLPACPAGAARHAMVWRVRLRRQERRERRVSRSWEVRLLLRRVRAGGSATVADQVAWLEGRNGWSLTLNHRLRSAKISNGSGRSPSRGLGHIADVQARRKSHFFSLPEFAAPKDCSNAREGLLPRADSCRTFAANRTPESRRPWQSASGRGCVKTP